jgi:hypothetical protein
LLRLRGLGAHRRTHCVWTRSRAWLTLGTACWPSITCATPPLPTCASRWSAATSVRPAPTHAHARHGCLGLAWEGGSTCVSTSTHTHGRPEWADVSLLASERYVRVLYAFLNNPQLREAACACVDEVCVRPACVSSSSSVGLSPPPCPGRGRVQIVLKGMRASAKVQLVRSLQLPAVLAAFAGEALDAPDTEGFAVQGAQLCNDVIVVLAAAWAELGAPEETGGDAGGGASAGAGGGGAGAGGTESAASSAHSSPVRRRPGMDPTSAPTAGSGTSTAGGGGGGGASRSAGRQAVEVTPLSPTQRQAQDDCYDVLEACLPLLFRCLACANQRVSLTVVNGVQAFVGVVRCGCIQGAAWAGRTDRRGGARRGGVRTAHSSSNRSALRRGRSVRAPWRPWSGCWDRSCMPCACRLGLTCSRLTTTTRSNSTTTVAHCGSCSRW